MTAVLPVVRGEDGVWEAVITPVFGSDDVDVRDDLASLKKERARVRVHDEVKSLDVFLDGEQAFVRYDDALGTG